MYINLIEQCNNNNHDNSRIIITIIIILIIIIIIIIITANSGYEFRVGETINHLLFMDDLKLYSKSERP